MKNPDANNKSCLGDQVQSSTINSINDVQQNTLIGINSDHSIEHTEANKDNKLGETNQDKI